MQIIQNFLIRKYFPEKLHFLNLQKKMRIKLS